VKNRKMHLSSLLSVALVFSLILAALVGGASATVPVPDDHAISHLWVDDFSSASATAVNTSQGQVTPMVAAGWGHTVGLKDDGTAFAVGDNRYGQCDIGGWTDITRIAAGSHHTVGLQADGTVVAVGWNHQGQCRVGDWTDIARVAAGVYHTVGVKSDGTVVAAGANAYGQCSVGDWIDIVQVTANYDHTVGVRSDGTVVAVGDNY